MPEVPKRSLRDGLGRWLGRLFALIDTTGPRWLIVAARWLYGRDELHALLTLALTLFGYAMLRPFFFQYASLPEAYYTAPFVLAKVIDADIGRVAFVAIPTYLLFVTRTGLRWIDIDDGKKYRNFIIAVLLLLVWPNLTREYNFYYDQPHTWDRVVLLLLMLAVWFTPALAPATLFYTVMLQRQMANPLHEDMTDWLLIFELLTLFSVYLYMNIGRRIRMQHFLLCALCLIGSFYLNPGLSKFHASPELSWVNDNRLANMFVAGRSHNWLSFIPLESIGGFAAFLADNQKVMAWGIIALECAGVLIFVHRRLTLLLLPLFASIHALIFAFTGILFWKWVCLDLFLFLLLRSLDRERTRQLFLPGIVLPVAASLAIWFAPGNWFKPPRLVWYTAKVNRIYHFEAETKSGKVHVISPDFMAPYDKTFGQNDFWYLDGQRHLAGIYGGTAYSVFKAVQATTNREQLEAVFASHGYLQPNQHFTGVFDKLIVRFFTNLNRRGKRGYWPSYFAPPHHIQSQWPGEVMEIGEPVVKVRVLVERTYFDGKTVSIYTPKTAVRQIVIPSE